MQVLKRCLDQPLYAQFLHQRNFIDHQDPKKHILNKKKADIKEYIKN